MSYAALDARSDRVVGALHGAGVGPGDRIVFLARNHPACFETILGASKIGAVPVPVNWRLSTVEIAEIVGDTQLVALFGDAAFVEDLRGAGADSGPCVAPSCSTPTPTPMATTSSRGCMPTTRCRRAPGAVLGRRAAVLHVGNDGRPEGRHARPPQCGKHPAEGAGGLESRRRRGDTGRDAALPRRRRGVGDGGPVVRSARGAPPGGRCRTDPRGDRGAPGDAHVARAGSAEIWVRSEQNMVGYWGRRVAAEPSGKVLKHALREPYWAGRSRRVN